MISRADLIDIPERRSVPVAEFEVREAGGTAHVEGYASIFEKGYDIYGGPESGGFTEFVGRSAFKTTLAAKPDVVLLENHTGGPLARTKSETLKLATDTTGLISQFDLDLRDPQAKSVFIKLDRGDYDEMSFAFRVKHNTWNDDETIRHLDEISLHKGDVSIVNFGANPYTSVGLRSAVKMLAREDIGPRELAELRAMSDQVDRAVEVLRGVRADKPLTPGAHHADPGFLDANGDPAKGGNGVPRYQIDDAAHVRDALSRFSANKGKYTSAQQEHIMDAIEAAAKKFGVTVSAEKNSLRAAPPNVFVGNKSAFAKQIHDMALSAGANCDPAGGTDQNPGLTPLRSLSPTLDYEPGLEDGDAFDRDSQQRDSLAQAVHDLVADADDMACGGDDDLDEPDDDDEAQLNDGRTLSAAAAGQLTVSKGNLTFAEVARMLRPEDAPEPMSLADAERLVS